MMYDILFQNQENIPDPIEFSEEICEARKRSGRQAEEEREQEEEIRGSGSQ